MLVLIFVQPICNILLIYHKYSVPLKHQRNWCQQTLPATCHPSRANYGAPVPAARTQLLIWSHGPVPIGSPWLIKPATPNPPIHFWTNMPCAVIRYFIFHQITCTSKPFLNRHPKRCGPVPSFLIRLPAPPSHFKADTPSTVSQSHNISSYSSLINDYSGIN